MKKYEMIKDDCIKYKGHILYRIIALFNFGNVEKGELGGYIESEYNLSHTGDCWIYGDSKVYKKAKVTGNAKIYPGSIVCGNVCLGNHTIIDRTKITCNSNSLIGFVNYCNSRLATMDFGYVYAALTITGSIAMIRLDFIRCSTYLIKKHKGSLNSFKRYVKKNTSDDVLYYILDLIKSYKKRLR